MASSMIGKNRIFREYQFGNLEMNDLDPNLLRTFLAFAESGSLSRAAEIVGRSASAVTAQMQRLELDVGEPLLAESGRGRVLTPTGHELAGHARRILAVHREAMLSLKGSRADGQVRMAATQDFAESDLPRLLRLFAATHLRVRLELRIGRSAEINAAFAAGEADLLLGMRGEAQPDEIALIREPACWLTASDGMAVDARDELPLALLDPPCGFRTLALAALEQAARPYRIAATSQSLAGLRTAVAAGLAVTLRTARSALQGLVLAPASLALPSVGDAVFALRLRGDATPAAVQLAALLKDELARIG
jgi:DNA-binding transcriptional LysR family regulator